MAARLDYVKIAPARVLDAGCGHGEDAPALRARYPHADVVGVDWAASLLREALRARPFAQRVRAALGGASQRLACADLERLPFADAAFGLVWSNLALGWSRDLAAVFAELNRVLEPGGLLMFSAYGPDTLMELRRSFSAVDGLAHVHRFVDMHDLGDMLVAAGFAAPVMDMEMITLTYADVPALFADLRRSGQPNAARHRRRGLTGRELWRGMLAAYEAERRDGRIPASIEIVYGHAWKGEPRRSDGRVPVRFEPRVAKPKP